MLSAPTCSSVDTRRTWSNDPSGNGSERTSACTVSILDVSNGEVGSDDVDARTKEPCEVRGLGERVANLEHTTCRAEPGQDPGDLHDPLVRARGRLQPPDPSAPCALREPERDGVVELAHASELLARRELVDERRPRERPVSELGERAFARVRLRLAPQHEAKQRVDDLLVRALVGRELRGHPRVHHAYS